VPEPRRRGRPCEAGSLSVRGRASVTIPADVAAEMDAIARELGWSRAELVSAVPHLAELPGVRTALRALAGLT
jgi:hypothetical protein